MPNFPKLRLAARLWTVRGTGLFLALTGDRLARLEHAPWRADPYPVYAELRAAGSWVPSRTGMTVVPGHDLCDEVLRDRRFGVQPPDRRSRGSVFDDQLPPSFLELDPPEHTRLRTLARPAFGNRRITGYRPAVERVAKQLLDRAATRESFDLMTDFAAPLPIAVITDLLGIPDADAAVFARYGSIVGASLDGVRSLRQLTELKAARAELNTLFARLIDERAADPGEDVISGLVAARGDGCLSTGELLATCHLLLIAGFETTVNLIGNAVHALLHDPAQWALLRENPELAEQVVEETLRYDPPVQITARIAQSDFDFHRHPVSSGQVVLLLLGATGRDERIFSRPGEFDLTRTPEAPHLAFSSGIHYCLGAALARLEATVALRALAERTPHLTRAGTPRRRPTATIRGLRSLPVRTT